MTNFMQKAFILPTVLSFFALPGSMAGPACARRHRQQQGCISKCAERWGWPGSQMGLDPWGAVLEPAAADSTASALSQACGVAISQPSLPDVPPTSVVTRVSALVASSPTNLAVSASSTISSARNTINPTTPKTSLTQTLLRSSPSFSSHLVLQTTPPMTSSGPDTSGKQSSLSSAPMSSLLPPSPLPSFTSSGSSVSTSSSDINVYLSSQNSVRSQHGAIPLVWSNDLANTAQQWANGCLFQHSDGTLGPFGENLAAGTGDKYGIVPAIQSWTNEVSQYNASSPQASHFTQVVWKSSTQVGCAEQLCDGIFAASFGKAQFFVCEYSPVGNVVGEFA